MASNCAGATVLTATLLVSLTTSVVSMMMPFISSGVASGVRCIQPSSTRRDAGEGAAKSQLSARRGQGPPPREGPSSSFSSPGAALRVDVRMSIFFPESFPQGLVGKPDFCGFLTRPGKAVETISAGKGAAADLGFHRGQDAAWAS